MTWLRGGICALAIFALPCLSTQAQNADPAATAAATQMLQEALTVQRDGRHNLLLRALRHLEDPSLKPLYESLSHADHPALRVHGLLGLAEVSVDRQLTLDRVADVGVGDTQNELISAALDGGLLDDADCQRLLTWGGLDPAVKLLLITQLISDEAFDLESPSLKTLIEALDHEALGQRGLAALLLHQLGDTRGTQGLIALNNDPSESRDAVRGMLLETAMQYRFKRAAPWAYSMSTEGRLPSRLASLSMEAAIRFGDARAIRRWAEAYDNADDISQQTRLTLTALEACRSMSVEHFEKLIASEDPFIKQSGRAGKAIAGYAPRDEVEAELQALMAQHHPLANVWVVKFAQASDDPELATWIAEALITAYVPGAERGRARRLDTVMDATELLAILDSQRAGKLLPPLINDPAGDPLRRQVILLGLIRSRCPVAEDVSLRLESTEDEDVRALMLVLRLTRDDPLSASEARLLESIVVGRVELDPSLRIQTAWRYLKKHGLADQALRGTLARS